MFKFQDTEFAYYKLLAFPNKKDKIFQILDGLFQLTLKQIIFGKFVFIAIISNRV